MKIRLRWGLGIAAALGLVGIPGSDRSTASAQVNDLPPSFPVPNDYWMANKGGLKDLNEARAGQWAEIINVTPKWIVVQDELGKQYPIASDRVRQFLIRWPSSTGLITNASVLEVTGPNAGSNVIITDHVDQFEGDSRSLVAPRVANNYNNYGFNYNFGFSHTLSPYDVDFYKTFGSTYFMQPFGYAAPLPLHVVGRALGNDPVRIAGNGDNWFTVQPAESGMTVTQVTVGNNTYARKGDPVYIVLDAMGARSLDIAQLVLYKKIPLNAYQP